MLETILADGKLLVISPAQISFLWSPAGQIAMRLDYPREQLWFPPDTLLGIEMSPSEARDVARTLIRMADEVEDKQWPSN